MRAFRIAVWGGGGGGGAVIGLDSLWRGRVSPNGGGLPFAACAAQIPKFHG